MCTIDTLRMYLISSRQKITEAIRVLQIHQSRRRRVEKASVLQAIPSFIFRVRVAPKYIFQYMEREIRDLVQGRQKAALSKLVRSLPETEPWRFCYKMASQISVKLY